jgi:hypothetical protein
MGKRKTRYNFKFFCIGNAREEAISREGRKEIKYVCVLFTAVNVYVVIKAQTPCNYVSRCQRLPQV